MATPTRGYSRAFQASLVGTTPARATPADAFRAARTVFLTGERLEMRDLAETLGVSRTTIYNWCGDRDQLLVDVLWSLAKDILDSAWSRRGTRNGLARLRAASEDVLRTLAAAPPLQALLRNETHAALRLLTGRGGFHDRFVEYVADRIREDATPVSTRPELVAEAIVCVIESGLYNYNIASVEPEIDRTLDIIDLLLRGAEVPTQAPDERPQPTASN